MKIGRGGEHCDVVVVVVVVVSCRLVAVVVVVLLGLWGGLMAQEVALVLGGRLTGALEVLRSPVVTWRTWSPTWWDALLLFSIIFQFIFCNHLCNGFGSICYSTGNAKDASTVTFQQSVISMQSGGGQINSMMRTA